MNTETQYLVQYTRANAIDDGVLCDVTTLAAATSWRVPVCVTAGLLAALGVEPDTDSHAQTARVRAALHAAGQRLSASVQLDDRVPFVAPIGERGVDAVVVVHRGDNLEIVATLMLSYED